MINGANNGNKLPIDMELLFTSTVASTSMLNEQKAVEISDRIESRNKLQRDLGEIVSLARKKDMASIQKMLDENPDLAAIVKNKLPVLSEQVTETNTSTRFDFDAVNRYLTDVRSQIPQPLRGMLDNFAGPVRDLINQLPEPFRGQANSLVRTITTTSTETVDKPLEGEALERAWQGFIDDMQRESDNFTPVNQMDLAAFQRVFQNDTLLQKSVSDISSTYHNTRKDIIGNFKA